MDNEVLNENEEEAKEEQKEMEKEDKDEKDEKDSGEVSNPMPEQASAGGEKAEEETAGGETEEGETEEGETEEGETEQGKTGDGETKDEAPAEAEGGKEEEGKKEEDEEDDTLVGKATKKAEPYLNKAKGLGDSLVQKYLNYSQNKSKTQSYKVGDFFRNLGDDIHYAKKGLLKKFKSGVGALKNKAANTGLGRWITKKKEERAAKKAAEEGKPKKPGFFGKLWGALKTGAGALKDKAVNSKFGKWVQKKKEEHDAKKAAEAANPKEPGFFSRTWTKIKTGVSDLKDKALNSALGKRVTKEISQGKAWLKEQKKWVDEKMAVIKEERDRRTEEDEAHNHERRIANLSKKDPDYGKRYKDLVEELKKNEGVKDLQNSISRDDVGKIMKELEAGKEDKEEKESTLGEKMGNGLDKIADKTENVYKYTDKISKAQALRDSKIIGSFAAASSAGDNFGKALAVHSQKKKTQALMQDEDIKKDNVFGRFLGLKEIKQERDQNNYFINAAKSGVKTAGKLVDAMTGSKLGSHVSDGVGLAMEGMRAGVNASNDKKARKTSIKGIMGGVEGYKALKEKYKMRAPEMRYAMLQVLGLQSEQDILNADVANLVHDAFNSKRKGADAVRGGAASEAEMYNMTNATDRGVKRSKLNLSQKTEEAAPAADTAVDKKPELQPA